MFLFLSNVLNGKTSIQKTLLTLLPCFIISLHITPFIPICNRIITECKYPHNNLPPDIRRLFIHVKKEKVNITVYFFNDRMQTSKMYTQYSKLDNLLISYSCSYTQHGTKHNRTIDRIKFPGSWIITACLHVRNNVLNSIILYPCINKRLLFHSRIHFDRSDNDKRKFIYVLS